MYDILYYIIYMIYIYIIYIYIYIYIYTYLPIYSANNATSCTRLSIKQRPKWYVNTEQRDEIGVAYQ